MRIVGLKSNSLGYDIIIVGFHWSSAMNSLVCDVRFLLEKQQLLAGHAIRG